MRIHGSLYVINTGLEYVLSAPVSALRYSGTDLPPPRSDHKASKGTRGHLGLLHTSIFSTEICFSQSEYFINQLHAFPPSLVLPLPVLQGFLTALWSWLSTTEWKPLEDGRHSNHSISPTCSLVSPQCQPSFRGTSRDPGEDPPTSLTPQQAIRNVSLG